MKGKLISKLTVFNFLRLFWAFWLFSCKLKNEEHLLPKSATDLLLQLFKGLTVVKLYNGQVVGHVTLWDLETGWYEMGTLWVDPKLRKHGVGEEIMKELLTQRTDKLKVRFNQVKLHFFFKFSNFE
ncbi:MAG: hypothetical protein UT02_C0023G0008 [Parcubacteria group bacterium GW2011_GWC2_38_7]|nr:MAG: hypothetical protein UT02_C0023G0008 [Parcubacteria group bacterium GW2011_GWC2_38_7]